MIDSASSIHFWSALIFLSSLIVLGIPHGAIDHYLFFDRRRMTGQNLLLFCSVYLGIATGFAVLWWYFPMVGVLGLIGLTWYHWGDGDRAHESIRYRDPGFLFTIWRGALPMLVPLLSSPEVYVWTLRSAGSWGATPAASTSFNFLLEPSVLLGLVIFLLVLALAHSIALRSLDPIQRKRIWIEDGTLVLLFLLLPPLASVGLYFCFWHSLRHIQNSCLFLGKPWQEKGRVHWPYFFTKALPFSAGGISLLILIWLWPRTQNEHGTLEGILGAYLVLLWALTWPHMICCKLSLNSKRQPVTP